MSYLRGVEAVGTGASDATTVAAKGVLWAAVGGGEKGRTRGLKLCPPRVLAMFGLGKRWRGWRISATPAKHNSKNQNVRMCIRE